MWGSDNEYCEYTLRLPDEKVKCLVADAVGVDESLMRSVVVDNWMIPPTVDDIDHAPSQEV